MVAWLNSLNFLVVLWLFPVVHLLHEAEEWNMVAWYHRHYQDLPPITTTSLRFALVYITLIQFVWCGLATIWGHPSVAAFLYLPGMMMACQNVVQHLYWWVYFRGDAPGCLTSVLFVLPAAGYLMWRALEHQHAPLWYVVLLALLMIPETVQTIRAKNTMIPKIRKIHMFAIRLTDTFLKRRTANTM